jgi:hypothetical protein
MMRTVAKMAFGAVLTAVAITIGPSTVTKVVKLFEPLPLSPLAKVVLEKLDTTTWQLQSDGISCDVLWIRGESEARNGKPLVDATKSISVFVRNASLAKEIVINDQLQPHDIAAILPKAQEMYKKLLAEKNNETANQLQAVIEDATPKPVKKVVTPQFTAVGKVIYGSLANKKLWMLTGREQSVLASKKAKLTVDTTAKSDERLATYGGFGEDGAIALPFNAEERTLILQRAKALRDELFQETIQAAVSTPSKEADADLLRELTTAEAASLATAPKK